MHIYISHQRNSSQFPWTLIIHVYKRSGVTRVREDQIPLIKSPIKGIKEAFIWPLLYIHSSPLRTLFFSPLYTAHFTVPFCSPNFIINFHSPFLTVHFHNRIFTVELTYMYILTLFFLKVPEIFCSNCRLLLPPYYCIPRNSFTVGYSVSWHCLEDSVTKFFTISPLL